MALAKLTRVVCKHVFDTNVDDLRDVPGAVCSFPLARRLARDPPPPPPPPSSGTEACLTPDACAGVRTLGRGRRAQRAD